MKTYIPCRRHEVEEFAADFRWRCAEKGMAAKVGTWFPNPERRGWGYLPVEAAWVPWVTPHAES